MLDETIVDSQTADSVSVHSVCSVSALENQQLCLSSLIATICFDVRTVSRTKNCRSKSSQRITL